MLGVEKPNILNAFKTPVEKTEIIERKCERKYVPLNKTLADLRQDDNTENKALAQPSIKSEENVFGKIE